jgi:hypothetical protein
MAKTVFSDLQHNIVRVAQIHFFFLFVYVINMMASRAWNLIPVTGLLQRLILATSIFVASVLAWYGARIVGRPTLYYRKLVYLLVGVDIAVATVSVYVGRGMASRSVILYVIPIVAVAILASRVALIATAAISSAMYALTAAYYFMMNPGEGYTAELYTEVGLYCAILFVLVALLWVVMGIKNNKN